MPKSLVGSVKNKKFAFFWLLIGGSIGNILLVLYSLDLWEIFLPSAILSILIVIIIADKTKRPKILLAINLLLVCVLLAIFTYVFAIASLIELTIILPSALIIFGCILGIMDW